MNQETGKAGGFFSKMFNKVKNSAPEFMTDPGDSELPKSQEALALVLERKRQNDAIRKQEFAELRQLRRQGSVVSASIAAPAPISGFNASAADSSSQASTLQKINAIEAQMAQQWWKPEDAKKPLKIKETAQMPLPETAGETVLAEQSDSRVSSGLASDLVLPPGMTKDQWRVVPTLGEESVVTPVSESIPTCPEMEEASILYAHGDISSATARLLELLVKKLGEQPVDNALVASLWHALLDVYRATGDEEGFEPMAIDYAAHFGRSAPLWFSMPEQLGLSLKAQKPALAQALQWKSPSKLTAQAVHQLQSACEVAPSPWTLNWDALSDVEPAAASALSRLLAVWSDATGKFVVQGSERLLQVVAAKAVLHDATVDPQWWALHMAVLRWLHRADAFEQVALDYCVTYEVSPPSWQVPRCEVTDGNASSSEDSVNAEAESSTQVQFFVSAQGQEGLAGIIEGDPAEWLEAAKARAQLGQVLVIPCDMLIRLDFVAAGALLNWASDMENEGYRLRFTQLHHLIAVFLQVLGVQHHAEIQVRSS